jgi:hypothetical protein
MSPQQIFMLKMFADGWGFRLHNKKPGSWNTYWSLLRKGYLKTGPCKQTKSGPVAIDRLTAKGRDALEKAKDKANG